MCNHLNLKVLIYIFTIIYLIMIIIIMRGENFVVHLDILGCTPVCRGTPVAHDCSRGILPLHVGKVGYWRSLQVSLLIKEKSISENIYKILELKAKTCAHI
jgi:hypothetical protein